MYTIKASHYIHVLFSSLVLLFLSCKDSCKTENSLFNHHEEKAKGLLFEFCIPRDYTKEIRKERISSPYFQDMAISQNGAIIYFSKEEHRSFFSISITDIPVEEQCDNKDQLVYFIDSLMIPLLVYGDIISDTRLPLLIRNEADNGIPYYFVMNCTRYSDTDSSWCHVPTYDSQDTFKDSVESECYYLTVIDNKSICIEFYSLYSVKSFSFQNILDVMNSIHVSCLRP